MKKTLIVFSILLSVIIGFTNFTSQKAPAVGDRFPDLAFKLTEGQGNEYFTFADCQGAYFLVNFWDSKIPDSRLRGAFYRQWRKTSSSNDIKLIEINFDEDEGILMDIATRDGLNVNSYIRPRQAEFGKIVDRLRMQDNLKSFLIDKDGFIVAINPEAADLDRFTGKLAKF